jgi:hypothetical protein
MADLSSACVVPILSTGNRAEGIGHLAPIVNELRVYDA